jgi:hypothetical protein
MWTVIQDITRYVYVYTTYTCNSVSENPCLSVFIWITGIMAALLEFDCLDYDFTLLCGLQGFVISLESLTTKQVVLYKMYNLSGPYLIVMYFLIHSVPLSTS